MILPILCVLVCFCYIEKTYVDFSTLSECYVGTLYVDFRLFYLKLFWIITAEEMLFLGNLIYEHAVVCYLVKNVSDCHCLAGEVSSLCKRMCFCIVTKLWSLNIILEHKMTIFYDLVIFVRK